MDKMRLAEIADELKSLADELKGDEEDSMEEDEDLEEDASSDAVEDTMMGKKKGMPRTGKDGRLGLMVSFLKKK